MLKLFTGGIASHGEAVPLGVRAAGGQVLLQPWYTHPHRISHFQHLSQREGHDASVVHHDVFFQRFARHHNVKARNKRSGVALHRPPPLRLTTYDADDVLPGRKPTMTESRLYSADAARENGRSAIAMRLLLLKSMAGGNVLRAGP